MAHFRRLEFPRIIDLFQNVSREAGSTSLPYDGGPFAPPVGVGFVKATSDGRCRDFTALMSAFGGKADSLTDLSACLLIASTGHH